MQTHLCYIHIFQYGSYSFLNDIDIRIDPHYNFKLDLPNSSLEITKNECIPDSFWGENIYSMSCVIGNNGAGKTTAIDAIMSSVVSGTDHKGYSVLLVYEVDGKLIYYISDNRKMVVSYEGKVIESCEEKYLNTFYYTSHFTPFQSTDRPTSCEWSGCYNASDQLRLTKDMEDWLNNSSIGMQYSYFDYLNTFYWQNNYRICSLIANENLRQLCDIVTIPKYIIAAPDTSGIQRINADRRLDEKYQKYKDLCIPTISYGLFKDRQDIGIVDITYHAMINLITECEDDSIQIETISLLSDWISEISNNSNKPAIPSIEFLISQGGFESRMKWNRIIGIINGILQCFENKTGLYVISVKDNPKRVNQLLDLINDNSIILTSKIFNLKFSRDINTGTQLSAGEKSFLDLFSRLYDAITVRPTKFSNIQPPSLIILDEAEVGFHPEWQRDYINRVISFLNSFSSKEQYFQVVISTHSPILLSDFPGDCITILYRNKEKDKTENIEVVKSTFGENVFNLYLDSYLLNREGLVGVFAKNKISDIVKKINQSSIGLDVALAEIKMIGDDHVRSYLTHIAEEKLADVDYYEKKIEELKNRK